MSSESKVERGIVVFCNWAVFGFIGLGFLLESLARDDYLISLVGVFGIITGFVGHMVINVVYKQPFTAGETAFGLTVFGVIVLSFVLNWVLNDISETDFFIGITLVSVLTLGFLTYVVTRFGVRGSFSRFHFNQPSSSETQE